MIDIFGSKVLSKLKKKIENNRIAHRKGITDRPWSVNGPENDSVCRSHFRVTSNLKSEIYLVGGYIDHYRLGFDDHDQQYIKLRQQQLHDTGAKVTKMKLLKYPVA